MKVLLYLYYPFYDNHLAGGVQVWLRNLVSEIQKNSDIRFIVVCPESNLHSFPKDVEVIHSLVDMEQDFLSPKKIYDNLLLLRNLSNNVDLIWSIDRRFPINTNKPILLSLNAFCYERELMSVFQEKWKYMVVPSEYLKSQFLPYVSNPQNIIKIPCYVDQKFLNKKPDKKRIKKYFDYDSRKKYILFPHRPESSKGHFDAIEIMKKLIKEDNNYILLIPEPPCAKNSNVIVEKNFINSVKKHVGEKGLKDYVIFHKWVSYEDIYSYYSCGEFTLFLSKLPESFGLSLLNSVMSYTPTISYNVGALSEVIPECKSHFIINSVNEAVDIILSGKCLEEVILERKKLKIKYKMKNTVDSYIDLIRKAFMNS